MKSLKCLSLQRVQRLALPPCHLLDLPATLAKDLMVARLFCGSFSGLVGNDSNTVLFQTALTIGYDGADWTFSYRTSGQVFYCCFNCDYIRPDLVTVTLKPNLPAPFFSPFYKTNSSMQNLVRGGQQEPPSVLLQVEVEAGGMEGVLIFSGKEGGIFFTSRLLVRVLEDGRRTLRHKATISGPRDGGASGGQGTRNGRGSAAQQYFQLHDSLLERGSSAEWAFPEPEVRDCTNEEWSDLDTEPWVGSQEDYFESSEEEEQEDWRPLPVPDWTNFLEDFWLSIKL